MNLKEAFRYQNYLTEMSNTVISKFRSANIYSVTETHLRSMSNPEARDEEINKTPVRDFDCSVDDLVDLSVFILGEKERLANKICETKASRVPLFDAFSSVNQTRRLLYNHLRFLTSAKETESEFESKAFMLNNEHNQVPYFYTTIKKCTPDFDVTKVRDISKSLIETADAISASLDKELVDTELEDFNPAFSPNDSFDDVVQIFLHLRTIEG